MGAKWTIRVPVLEYQEYDAEFGDKVTEDGVLEWFDKHGHEREPDRTFGGDSGQVITAERDPPVPTTNLQCPNCGSCGDFQYHEDIGCSRKVIVGEPGDETLKIHGYYTTEGFDEDGRNGRFYCVACGLEWPVPDDLCIEWV